MDPKEITVRHWTLWGVCFGVYMFYVFGHRPVSDVLMYLSDKHSEKVYAHYVVMTGKILLAVFFLLLAGVLHRATQKAAKLFAWLLLVALVYVNYHRMVSYSVEYVHFIQYFILTVVLFYATGRNPVVTAVISLMAGVLDESYQTGWVEPINWRDCVLNMVGTASGFLFVWTMQGWQWSGGGRAWAKKTCHGSDEKA